MSESFTKEDREKVSRFLSTVSLSEGVGVVESPCSIAAINLALTGVLNDERPPCMSPIIHRFIMEVQDAAGPEMRNSKEWKALLPWAAGSLDEEEIEQERLLVIRDWMWDVVLPKVRPPERLKGAWATMLQGRSQEAARAFREFSESLEDVSPDCHFAAAYAESAYDWKSERLDSILTSSVLDCILSAAQQVAGSLTDDVLAMAKQAMAKQGLPVPATYKPVHDAIWRSFEPAALLRRLIEHPNGLPAGWEA
jgi:hypothetical protein